MNKKKDTSTTDLRNPSIFQQGQKYRPDMIESKWQAKWEDEKFYQAKDFDKRKKFYTLIEFPYPSGAGLHVGHVRSWSAMDAYSRKKRMEGYNVLYPMGWDAFGLPAENYAIKMKVHPSEVVPQNIARFKKQCKSLGLSFDWSREVNTTDPYYYKWTQWIFLRFFEKGLAYQADVAVNWCSFCKTNLADEEVLANGTHERCGKPTEKRMQKQWLLKITEYAQRLIDDLKTVDYSHKIKVQQENWIGKREGTLIKFQIVLDSPAKAGLLEQYSSSEVEKQIEVFTTRGDTLYGATFIVIAPEFPLVNVILNSSVIGGQVRNDIEKYIKSIQNKSEIDRTAENKEKTGVFTGLYAINPLNNEKLPVWIADYALMGFGTGALFGDAHDERDVAFAKKYGIPLKATLITGNKEKDERILNLEECFTGDGALVESGEFSGLTSEKAREKVAEWLEKNGKGSRKVTYHLRDWVFSRQHYWGEPIPIIYCRKCWEIQNSKFKVQSSNINGVDYAIIPVPEEQLPVELPYLKSYEPSGTGESPLANVSDWVNTMCPKCGGPARRETDTMPNWAGSNWYFLAYLLGDQILKSKNQKYFKDPKIQEKFEYWMPVDLYQGGFEHTTLHLLYSRFVYKFLFDIGVAPTSEPYAKRRSHGIVLGPDGRKMSKSFGNVINPEDIVGKFGADTLRVYEMFMGPFEQTIAWSEEGVEGCFRFLKRVWQLTQTKISSDQTARKLASSLHKTIKKAGEDIENIKFNTAVSALMEFINEWQKDEKGLSKEDIRKFLLILAPFAPHLTEELWQMIARGTVAGFPPVPARLVSPPDGGTERLPGDGSPSTRATPRFESVHQQPWPAFDPKKIEEEEATIAIQINGKTRDAIKIQSSEFRVQNRVEDMAKQKERVRKYLEGKNIKKVIYVEGRIINFVTE